MGLSAAFSRSQVLCLASSEYALCGCPCCRAVKKKMLESNCCGAKDKHALEGKNEADIWTARQLGCPMDSPALRSSHAQCTHNKASWSTTASLPPMHLPVAAHTVQLILCASCRYRYVLGQHAKRSIPPFSCLCPSMLYPDSDSPIEMLTICCVPGCLSKVTIDSE